MQSAPDRARNLLQNSALQSTQNWTAGRVMVILHCGGSPHICAWHEIVKTLQQQEQARA